VVAQPFDMVVEAGKVREFALAVRSSDPEHLGDEPVSPATFLASSVWWQSEESSAWHGVERDFTRILHGEQEFVFHGEPPGAGTVLQGESRIAREYTTEGKRGGAITFTDVLTSYTDRATGRLVAEVTSTTIETGQAVTG
jgi:hypothetical protein